MKNIILFSLQFILFTTIAQEYSVSKINPDLSLNVNAVIRNNEQNIWLHDYNDMSIENKFVVSIFNQKAWEQLQFYILYDDFDSVKNYYATIYDNDGEKIKTYKKKNFLDVSATGSNLYSDDRALLLDFTPTFFPFTIEFYYLKKTTSTAFIPAFHPYPFSNISSENASYTFYNEKNIPIISKKNNIENYDISITETETKYSYSIKNIRPLLKEELCPSYNKIMPWVRLVPVKFQLKGVTAEIRNWDDFAKWQNEKLLKGMDKLDENTISEINQLVMGVEDPKEKTKRIYEFMQNKTRYISVQIGIGGWQPFPAKEVDKLGYGDCKGLTNYTKALLKTQNIESYYTLVDSQSNGLDLDEDFVALQGDHAILSVPINDELIFLECTSQDLPFNFLGTHTDNRKVLMITPEGGIFKKTHTYTFQDNNKTTNINAVLDDELTLRGKVESKSYGLKYDEIYRIENQDVKDKELYYKSELSFHNGLSIDAINFNNDKNLICFTESFNFKSPYYVTKAGNRILLNPNLYNRIIEIPKKDGNRVFPLEIKRGYSYNDEINLQIPENYIIESMFDSFNIESEFGKYSCAIEKEGNTLIYQRELELYAGEWEKEKFNDYVDFIKQIAKKDKSKIILKKL